MHHPQIPSGKIDGYVHWFHPRAYFSSPSLSRSHERSTAGMYYTGGCFWSLCWPAAGVQKKTDAFSNLEH